VCGFCSGERATTRSGLVPSPLASAIPASLGTWRKALHFLPGFHISLTACPLFTPRSYRMDLRELVAQQVVGSGLHGSSQACTAGMFSETRENVVGNRAGFPMIGLVVWIDSEAS
jgi:hypothetical protein